MITKDKIDRINELARKSMAEGLTDEEIEERDILRREYIAAFRENLKAQLDSIKFVDEQELKDQSLDEIVEEVIDDAEDKIDEEIAREMKKNSINPNTVS